MSVYFSEYFEVAVKELADYGAFNVCLESDLPLFVDPFLLFHSEKEEYQALHESIIKYLKHLRDKSRTRALSRAELEYFYCFKEVKENWLGFTFMGNEGHGLSINFARDLHGGLNRIFSNFGEEELTKGSHLEKVGLISGSVGRDSISDFTTNLIKSWLLQYTQTFARNYLSPSQIRTVAVNRSQFDYSSGTWRSLQYDLPWLEEKDQFVLLTPVDMLTRDEAWINRSDLIVNFHQIPLAIPDEQLRLTVSQFYHSRLAVARPSKEQRVKAAEVTIAEFPSVLDYYIRSKEDAGDEAVNDSNRKVREADEVFRRLVSLIRDDLREKVDSLGGTPRSYSEALVRANAFKGYVENQDGYVLLNNLRRGNANEKDVQLAFGLIWYGSALDVNREVNNGRGPVDFKVSYGDIDKTLIELKLASNRQLRRNLENQVAVYEKANRTASSVTMIVFFSEEDERRMRKILQELEIEALEWLVLVDARSDNKPSGSKA